MSTWRAVYGCDTETDWTPEEDRTWVCQWSLSDGERCDHGRDVGRLMMAIDALMRKTRYKTTYIYFHNLKFDLEFLNDSLLEWKRSKCAEVTGIVRRGRPVLIRVSPLKGQWKGVLEIRDSLLKLPQTRVKDLGRLVGLDKLVPPSEDGKFHAGWSEELDFSDPHVYDYVDHDAAIVALAMRKLHREGWTHSTVTGDAWRNAHALVEETRGRFSWQNLFPELPLEMDRWCRRAYIGGVNFSEHIGRCEGPITHVDIHSSYPSVMAGVPIGDMQMEMPVGKPYQFSPEMPSEGLWIGEMVCRLKLKPGMRPWLMYPSAMDAIAEDWDCIRPFYETHLPHVWVWTSVDWRNINRFYYVLDLEFRGAWRFHGEVGTLKPYVEHWYAEKEKARREHGKDSMEYVHSKRMINALYGRFGLDTQTPDASLDLDDNGNAVWQEVEKPYPEDGMTVGAGDCYVPYAAFATSYARYRLLDPMAPHGDRPPMIPFSHVIHMDTDSIIYYGRPIPEMLGEDLGTWGLESQPTCVYEGGPKRYIELSRHDPQSMDDVIGMACAGVPDTMRIELYDDMWLMTKSCELGHEHYRVRTEWLREWCRAQHMDPDDIDTRKLLPTRVRGGVILTRHTHHLDDMAQISVRWVHVGHAI